MKGISLCFKAALVVIFAIAAIVFLYWFLISQFLQIHVFFKEQKIERSTTNIANVILSHKDFIFEERGIIDSEKLDVIAYPVYKNEDWHRAYIEALKNPKNLDIGYPNSIVLFGVVDLEKCSKDFCEGWIGSFQGPILLDLPIKEFALCLIANIDLNVGTIFRYLAFGVFGGTIWQPIDLKKCYDLAFGEKIEPIFLFSSADPISEGFPVLIRYSKNGDSYFNAGRLFVGVFGWV